MLLSNIPALVGNMSTVGGSFKKKGEEYSPCVCKGKADVFTRRPRQRGGKLCKEYSLNTQINVPRATPSNVKDREMFKRDEVAISLITSEA